MMIAKLETIRMKTLRLPRPLIWIPSIALVASAWLAVAGQAVGQTVSVTLVPGSAVDTTIDVTSTFGSDTDGPTPVAVSGVAEALITTEIDPVHGPIVTSLVFTSSDLTFADTDFQVTIFIPIDISLVGIEGVFSPDELASGVGVSPGTSEFDVSPLAIEWTAGEIVVLDPPGIPAANTIFPLQGTAVVSAVQNGPSIDLTITIPVSSVDVVTEADITVTTTLDGTLSLTGSFTPPAVPALDPRGEWVLISLLVGLGAAALRTPFARRTRSGLG